MKIRSIYLVVPQNILVHCLKCKLEVKDRYDIIGTNSDGISAYNEIRNLKPDLVITELNLNTLSSINLIRKIKASGLLTKIILLSSEV